VVREGSHPLAQPRPASPQDLPPARPVAPPAAGAPRTSGVAPKSATPGPLVEKSLDEVILAYLAQGGDNEPR
jgi:hypothetical protein